MRAARFLAAALMCAASPNTGHAQDIDAAQRAFVERFVAAITSGTAESMRALYHPASLACVNPGNRDFFDFLIAKDLSYAAEVRGGYSVSRFGTVDATDVTASGTPDLFPDPVKPTHQFQIDTSGDGGNRSLSLLRAAAQQDGTWFIVVGCPTEKGLAFFRERQAEAARQRQQVAQLIAKLHEPLLSEIRTLLAQNRRVEAINQYQNAANVDLTTAVQVIDALRKPSQ
jgi:hypothetical protein